MGEQEPEAKDWLGKDIEDSISNDFGIDSNDVSTLRESPDAVKR